METCSLASGHGSGRIFGCDSDVYHVGCCIIVGFSDVITTQLFSTASNKATPRCSFPLVYQFLVHIIQQRSTVFFVAMFDISIVDSFSSIICHELIEFELSLCHPRARDSLV
jgi:hypothetical protein